ncbi:DUF3861 domain-containing protein [Endozoicomonas sp.]|uniref:DUF3861 domain-containing protein n=1 Tax=Endozoicomonas sp. TaxID=1892382 RepID=UPI003AF9E00B
MKKGHHYTIRLEHTLNPDGSTPDDQPVEFNFISHDEIFGILKKLKQRPDIEPETAEQLGLGIKLFGGVLLQHRNSELFSTLAPHFADFMKALKKSG